jgi:hypothetical protein
VTIINSSYKRDCLFLYSWAAKDHELRQAVKDYDSQLNQATLSLAEFKHRALTAEVIFPFYNTNAYLILHPQLQLEESHTNISRTQELEKEVKEKVLLIGKLRHEGSSSSQCPDFGPRTQRHCNSGDNQ